MAKLTVSEITEAVEKEYANLDITLDDGTEVRLLNVLQLPKERRMKVQAVLKDIAPQKAEADKDSEDVNGDAFEEKLDELIKLVAMTPAQGDALLAVYGDNMAAKVYIFKTYMKGTEAGEASSSQS